MHVLYVFLIMQGCANVTDVSAENKIVTPYIMVVGTWQQATQAFLVVDKQVVMDVAISDIPLILMSAFFVFNIQYPNGCANFYTFMEVFTLGFGLENANPSVKNFVSSLEQN